MVADPRSLECRERVEDGGGIERASYCRVWMRISKRVAVK